MEVQILGTKKCADSRKAERFFKERGIKIYFRDLTEKSLSKGEIANIANQHGGIDALIDRAGKEFEKRNLKYMSVNWIEALEKYPLLTRTPIVRSGGKSTIGHSPEVWQSWLDKAKNGG